MSKVTDRPPLCPVCDKPTELHEKACDASGLVAARQAEQDRASRELARLSDRFAALLESQRAAPEPTDEP